MVISEIYAAGSNDVSAFVIVEKGEMVHYGSHNWGGTISFGGVSAPSNTIDCEVLAVICGLMMCRNNNRMSVNIYTGSYDSHKIYIQGDWQSPFAEILKKNCEGFDLFVDKWPIEFLNRNERKFYKNPFVIKVLQLIQEQ